MLTDQQYELLQTLNKQNIKCRLVVGFEDGIPMYRFITVYDSSANRKVLMKALRAKKRFFGNKVRTIEKVKSFGNVINGKTDVEGMNVTLENWDTCKVIGTRQVKERVPKYVPLEYEDVIKTVPVTDCEIRSGAVAPSDVTPSSEAAQDDTVGVPF